MWVTKLVVLYDFVVSPRQGTNSFHVVQIAYLVSSEIEQKSQIGNLQVVLSKLERGVKISEETSLSATLVVDKVQPSNNGVTDSENDGDDVKAIKIISDMIHSLQCIKRKLKRMRL